MKEVLFIDLGNGTVVLNFNGFKIPDLLDFIFLLDAFDFDFENVLLLFVNPVVPGERHLFFGLQDNWRVEIVVELVVFLF